jgi:hypothetical protein
MHNYNFSDHLPTVFLYMGREFSKFWPAPTLALTITLVGCSPLKSSARPVSADAGVDSMVHGDGGPPVSSATGGNSGRGGRPGWTDTEPAEVGGMQGSGSGGSGGAPGSGGGTGSDAGSGGTGGPGDTGGAGAGGTTGGSTGGQSGTGGAGGGGAGGAGGAGMGGRGGTSGSGTGGIEIPGNNSNGTGGAGPSPPVFVPPTPSDNCSGAPRLPMDRARMDLPISTKAANASMAAPCGPAAPDVFFSFSLGTKEAVYADTFGASWNTMIFFAKSCTGAPITNLGGPAACSDNACGTMQSQAVAILDPGTYYLVISGGAGQTGDATVHFEHTPLGSGATGTVAAGTSTLTGTTSGAGNLEFCEAAAADNSYWWATCPDFQPAAFNAATCGGTSFDTVVSLQIPRIGLAQCNDDACGFQSRIVSQIPVGAGLNVVSVDGSTGRQSGAYSLTVTRP